MMDHHSLELSRRLFLRNTARLGAAAAGLAGLPSGALADLLATPRMTEGPFYPDSLPLDTDNDLLIVNDAIDHAVGEITHLSGRALSAAGEPLRNAVIEIWQVDNHGVYLHSGSNGAGNRDKNFQGYGRFLTDSQGRYYFRTIKPVPYPGRTPHIHVGVSQNGHRVLTTQFFVKGEPQNQRDGILRSLTDAQRDSVVVDFRPLEGSKLGELTAECDLVLGRTPAENEEGKFPGVVARPEFGGGADGRSGRRGRPPRPSF